MTSGSDKIQETEERLRALYTAAYLSPETREEPSADLGRRVAEMAARRDRTAARPVVAAAGGLTRRPRLGWGPVAGVTAALLMAAAKLAPRGPASYEPRSARTLARRPSFVPPMLAARSTPPPGGKPQERTEPSAFTTPGDRGHGNQGTKSTFVDSGVREGGLRALVAPGARPPSLRSSPAPVARSVGTQVPLPTRSQPALDDLGALNGDALQEARSWAPLRADQWGEIEARVRESVRVRDDFVTIPFPRLASASDRQIAQAVEGYRREAAIVDPRLSREVTLQQKATALADLCDRLRAETGIELTAGPSVADEKVTVFCEKLPLRDVMRQLSRPFGYTWLRSRQALGVGGWGLGKGTAEPDAQPPTPNPQYHYELVQDLRSQLLEEELRNQDRNAALLALDQEMSQYRPYFGLTPDEALVRSRTAAPAERRVLERYAGTGWGPAQIYYRLSPQEIAALRAGERITYSVGPGGGEQALPPELARGALESLREARLRRNGDEFQLAEEGSGVPPATLPDVRPKVTLEMAISDLGQFTLVGGAGINLGVSPGDHRHWLNEDPIAVGISPSVRDPQNAAANAALVRDPALRPRVSVRPQATFAPALPDRSPRAEAAGGTAEPPRERRVTSAEVLEALHRATGMPIISDFYTRLYPLSAVSVQDRPLFDTLNRLSDAMRLRWRKETASSAGGAPARPGAAWLQFRSASFFHDRLKEVPNRLLARWAAARKERGALSLDDLLQIAGLADAQLDGADMAEGAQACWGLAEWGLPRNRNLRPHLRFLAALTPAQRQAAMTAAGLAFTRLTLPQQQRFIALAFGSDANRLESLDELARATLRVDLSTPGRFEWRGPEVSAGPGALARSFGPPSFDLPPVREASREAALAAARRIDPGVTETQIRPTELAMTVEYSLGPNSRYRPVGIRAEPERTMNFNGLVPR